MEPSIEELARHFPVLAGYVRKPYRGANDRRAKSFRQAWDFAAEHGGILQTAGDAAARRVVAARLNWMDDPSLLPQHTRTLALHYQSEGHWFIAFDDNPTHENLAWALSHAYGSPSQYAAAWTHPLDGQVYAVLERAHEAGRILAHPAYDHTISGTWLKAALGEQPDSFAGLPLSQALFGDLLPLVAEAFVSLGREAVHYHLPRTEDLDEQVSSHKVLIVPVVMGGAHAMSPVIHLERAGALMQGVDTYLAAAAS